MEESLEGQEGQVLGSYRLGAKLGEGGMGAVYLAEHTLLGRRVALKVLLPEHSKNQELVTRFFNEARTVANLRHPAIVEVFDFGLHTNGSAFLVMELLEGESLAKRLENGPLAPPVAADIARLIAIGVGAAHAHGIVHRDLKPDNIILVPDADDPTHERVKILDFGIAKLLTPEPGSSKATRTGALMGTPLFMSPEQCKGAGEVDARADIYSLGCILYAMLAGRPPFAYEGIGEIIGAHLFETPASLRSLNPAIPTALDAVVQKALSKKPDDRQPSMVAFAEELVEAMGLRVTAAVASTRSSVPALATSGRPASALATAPTTLGGSAGTGANSAVAVRGGRAPLWIAGLLVLGGAGATVFLVTTSKPQLVAPSAPSHVTMAMPANPTASTTRPLGEAGPSTAAPVAAVRPATTPEPPTPAPEIERAGGSAGSKRHTGAAHSAVTSAGRVTEESYLRGVAASARADDVAAMEAFRAYLSGSNLPAQQRADAERQVIALGRRLGELDVLCQVPGATVALDGRPIGRAPLDRSVVVRPGVHDLVVDVPGAPSVHKTISVAAGERKPLLLR